MEIGSENDPQEDAAIVRNPMHCMAPLSAEKFDKSEFLSAVGVMGEIYLQRIKRPAKTDSTRSPWGVKNLSKRHDSTVPVFYGELLVQEAQIIRNLDFACIAGAMSSDCLDECKRNLAVEYCSVDLAAILAQRYKDNLGPLEAPKAMKAAFSILGALDYLHTSVLMLHGDLKSFNVLVVGDFKNVKICGLGPLSKSLNPDGTLDTDSNAENDMVGVGLWSAPEVFVKNSPNISSKVDIFSFGLVVYEMMVCMPPHTFPGIMDLVIAAPNELIKVRNSQKGQDPDLMDGDEDSLKSKKKKDGVFFARKRLPAQNTVAGYEGVRAMKKMKYDDVIIDLDAEEEPTKEEPTPKENDSVGKENEGNLIQNDNNADNDIKNDQQALGKDHDIKDQGLVLAAPAAIPQAVHDGSKVGNENSTANSAVANEAAVKEVSSTESLQSSDSVTLVTDSTESMLKVESSSDAPPKRPEDSSEVVMVIDSSDEENDPPNKAYEVDSSDSEMHDGYGSDGDGDDVLHYSDGEEFGETDDEEYDAAEDNTFERGNEEDDWDIDGNFLNYGCLGTRPPIPAEITFGKEYDILMEMFYVCTYKMFALRPNAAQLLKALQDNYPAQP
ncbi:serine/threonine-protein kinase PKH1-like [Anopheles stephensi]|uniref:serine/threonine-protein kinase PKH1-like n=1 Tax=Anopheles stephensi TaxID=30069 RepID=UPI0016588221|nr:serine/threonine-protein kinase PKH1-like [Anopheles stephensi]XP_035891169.1 serine/threonine-protein kinase PKH1-like [Anopheles stephensi]XP_035891178.1 serine/threonine-protein kinase PKH1-like [Anopheles stephensi]